MNQFFRVTFLILFLGISPTASYAETITLQTSPIPLHGEQPDVQTVGKLTYRGGLVLESSNADFGGFSSLDISPDGRILASYSDQGFRLETRLEYDIHGKLNGVSHTTLEPVYGLNEKILSKKKTRDAEAMTRLSNGDVIVAFERKHRLLRYTPGNKTPSLVTTPQSLPEAPFNEGIEALTKLSDGRLLALTQGIGNSDTRTGWIGGPDDWSKINYPYEDGFEPAGATTLATGDIIILERRYRYITGVAIRLRHISIETLDSIIPEATLNGTVIAELKPPLNIDNMEGIAAISDPKGNVIIYMISDDNFDHDDQRTLLLMFSLESNFQ